MNAALKKRLLNPNRAVGIIRASTDREGQQKNAERTQRSAIEAWCARSNVELVEVFVDRVSGGVPLIKRVGLMAALNATGELDCGVLIAAKRDRLARSVELSIEIQAIAKKLGVQIVTADGTASDDTPVSAFMRVIVDSVAELEKHLIGDRIKQTMAVRKAAGKTYGPPPFGYRAEDGLLVEDPAEQFVIKLVEKLHAEGQSERAITRSLDQAGVKSRKGVPFLKTSVHNMLARRSLVGNGDTAK